MRDPIAFEVLDMRHMPKTSMETYIEAANEYIEIAREMKKDIERKIMEKLQ